MHSRTLLPARANRPAAGFTGVTRPFGPAETAVARGSGHDLARMTVSADVIQRATPGASMVGLDQDEESERDENSGSASASEEEEGPADEQEEKGPSSGSDSDREWPPLPFPRASAPRSPAPKTPDSVWHPDRAATPRPRPGVRSAFPLPGLAVTPQPQPSSRLVPRPQFRTPQLQGSTPVREASKQGLLSPEAHRNPDIVGGGMHPTMRAMLRDLTARDVRGGHFARAMNRVKQGKREPMSADDVAERQSHYKDPLAGSAADGRSQIHAYHVESNAMVQRLAARVAKGETLTRDDNVALARMYGRGDALLSRMGGPHRARYPGRGQMPKIHEKMRRLQAISTLPTSVSAYGETKDAWATRVSSILSFRSLSTGTNVRPADLPPDAQASLRKFGQRNMRGKRYLVLAHGKNRHAGGRGDKALNLAPATPRANREHSQQVEERLKALLFNGEVVGYDVRFPRRPEGDAAPAPVATSDAERQKLALMTRPQRERYEEERRKKQEVLAEERKLPVSIKYNLRRIEMDGQEPKATHKVAKGTIPNRIPTTEPTTLVPVRINNWDPRRMKARRGQGWTRKKKPAKKEQASSQ